MINLSSLIDKEMTAELEEELKEEYSNLRIIRPGYCYTQDVRPGRMNIRVNTQNIIIGYFYG